MAKSLLQDERVNSQEAMTRIKERSAELGRALELWGMGTVGHRVTPTLLVSWLADAYGSHNETQWNAVDGVDLGGIVALGINDHHEKPISPTPRDVTRPSPWSTIESAWRGPASPCSCRDLT